MNEYPDLVLAYQHLLGGNKHKKLKSIGKIWKSEKMTKILKFILNVYIYLLN